jgi:hypothetical protein
VRTIVDVYRNGSAGEKAGAGKILTTLAPGGDLQKANWFTWFRAERVWRRAVRLFRNLHRANPEGQAMDYLLATKCQAPSDDVVKLFRLDK